MSPLRYTRAHAHTHTHTQTDRHTHTHTLKVVARVDESTRQETPKDDT
jgi:hypothetical protein